MYFKENRKSLLMFAITLAVILVSSFFACLIQSDGFSVTVTDLRDATNEGTIVVSTTNADGVVTENETKVAGKVVSGILFMPKEASAVNKLPAVVLTHGYLNNRELQLQNAIELARRGFIVLTIDREGHGNYENTGTTGALMATNGLYDSVKYLYNLDCVDRDRIGISGHSMGGYTTASVLMTDSTSRGGLGLVSAGLMQGWSTFMGAGPGVSVGMLKAMDDEFFFASKDLEGNPTICREYLHSVGAAGFVGLSTSGLTEININSGDIYVNGSVVDVEQGTAVGQAFRVIYEADEIHPLNHFSVESAGYVVDFFYNAFGTPAGNKVIASTNQTWWIKEAFSTIGLAAFFVLIFPTVSLLLTVPFFADLRKKRLVTAEGVELASSEATEEVAQEVTVPELKGVQKHVSYWLVGVLCTLFSGFSIHIMCTEYGGAWFPNTALYPQDTTNWVAMWAIVCGLFALALTLLVNIINRFVNQLRYKELAPQYNENPFAVAHISGKKLLKTLLLAFLVVGLLYLVLFINWGIFAVDFRFWSFDVKVFNVGVMLPTMIRYMLFFGIFYSINAILNQGYAVKNLPEWATIAINAFFNVFGILLVMLIQYGTFRSTGVLWQGDMALGYIVLFPIIPILIIATIISRLIYKKTGNIWLGAFINTILFTVITVANTAASFSYIMG